jgi:hypothetical protein
MPNIIKVKVPMKSRPTKEPPPGDDGASTLNICFSGRDEDGRRAYFDLDMNPFAMPADKSTIVVLDITATG